MLVELSPTSSHLASTPNGSRSVSPISCNGVSSASCLLMVRPARSMFHSCSSATAVEICEGAHSFRCVVHSLGARVASCVVSPRVGAFRVVAVAPVPSRGALRWCGFRTREKHSVLAGSHSWLSRLIMHIHCSQVPPNLSLNPDAPPAGARGEACAPAFSRRAG